MTNNANTPRRRRWWVPVIIVAVVLALIAGFTAMVSETSGPAQSEPSGTIATAEVDGREIAVVTYKADTFPHIDLRRIESIGFSTQAEAFDLDTGERVWDTMLFAEFGGTDARVLGTGSKYVYLATAEGLMILDASNGDILARDDEIAGLGEDYIAQVDAYTWDAVARAVVLLNANGEVLSIPADSLDASRAPADLAARWSEELGTGDPGTPFSPEGWEQLDSQVPLPDGSRVDPAWATDGWDVDVLLEDGTGLAAGQRGGFAVTETYQPVSSDASYLFQAGDPATGRLIGTVEAESSASAVTVSEAGHVVMLSVNDSYQGLLIVATADGIRSSVIGERGWFGW